MRRLLPVSQLESLLSSLQSATFPTSSSSADNTPVSVTFSRNDILRRIEDDRERHKRLRERIWVLPVPTAAETASITKLSTVLTTTSTSTAHTSPESPASPAVQGEGKLVSLADYRKESRTQLSATPQIDSQEVNETALDIEFEQAWELLGEDGPLVKLDEADLQAMEDENARCFG
jgi:CTD kinase subunit gamma